MVHWTTIHRILKRNCLMTRIRKKQKQFRRFQRTHVDSLWQFDVYEFRISKVGKVHVFDILDDRSRFLVMARSYRKKGAVQVLNCLRWALKNGRRPKAIYVDNGTCFNSKLFRQYCENQRIKLIFGRPYNPKGRGKLERFHKVLHDELISQIRFQLLSHFKRQLWLFRRKYNNERLQGAIGWVTPSEIYYDRRLMNENMHLGGR